MTNRIENSITINATPAIIWETLTQPTLMRQWMGEPEMGIEVHTDWQVKGPILINGFHHVKFENKGIVLQYDINSVLKYSHFSSVSRLADIPENYSIIRFILTPIENQTILTLTIDNFPTETIFKHLEFYWRTTITLIKEFVEKQMEAVPPAIIGR
nr:SRPBCC domain-containing protein [uncultured Pedobacter sp.]